MSPPHPGSGSRRALGGVTAGQAGSSSAWPLLAGGGRRQRRPSTRAASPYLYCPKNWEMHPFVRPQGKWKLRLHFFPWQVMVAPLSPQT